MEVDLYSAPAKPTNNAIPFILLEYQIYSVRSRTTRKKKSARVSVPPRLVYAEEKDVWVWRTDLFKTEGYWHGWYEGLSKKFLSCRVVKVLMLAGRDRMDTELTIAQMQGKFKLVLLPDVGHCLQEDVRPGHSNLVCKALNFPSFLLLPSLGPKEDS